MCAGTEGRQRTKRSGPPEEGQRERRGEEGGSWNESVGLLETVELLERLQLFDQRLVLILQHGHPTLEALDVLLLLPTALLRRLPATTHDSHALAVIVSRPRPYVRTPETYRIPTEVYCTCTYV